MTPNRVAAGLLCLQSVMVGWVGWCMSPNKTEVGHMGAAVYWWHTLRFDVFCVNPPLTRMVTSVPVALMQPDWDPNCYSECPRDRSEWAFGMAFLAANSPQRLRWCFALARWSLMPLIALGGYFGFRLSRELYGDRASIVFLVLWCFSPMLLAWGATICPDAVAAAFGLIAVYWLRRWLLVPGWGRAAVAGVCLGLLPLCKLTWIVAFGVWPLIWCVWRLPIRPEGAAARPVGPPLRQLVALWFIGLYTLNAGYLFDGTLRPLGQYSFVSQTLRGRRASEDKSAAVATNRFAGTWLGAIPVPLPAEFVQGVDTQRYDFERGLPSYLRGQWSDHGWWYYYLYALAIKEPLGTWCLVALATGATIWGRWGAPSWRDEMVVLVPPLAILAVVSSQSGFSIHSRYILPAVPLLLVWTSKVGRVFDVMPSSRWRWAMASTAILGLAWTVASSLSVYPHSLSYFNELAAVLPTPADASYPTPIDGDHGDRSFLCKLNNVLTAGPRNGPRHLLDSNIDWGQDLCYLEDWYASRVSPQPIMVAYSGLNPLEQTKIKSAGFPPASPEEGQIDERTDQTAFGPLPGWYAVSVNHIYGRDQRYRYFLNFEPVAMAGYSIYIYNITLGEANRVRRALGLKQLVE